MRTHTAPADSAAPFERLIRVAARRRGTPVELRVHYEVTRAGSFDSYRILAIDEPGNSTSTGTGPR